jgi:23S rRNA-/tRNA-specific pseudouridylate synthase
MSNCLKKTKLQQLGEYLLKSLKPVIKTNNIDAWQESGTLIINGEDRGENGYQVAKWKHTGVIAIENFPQQRINAYNLLAMVAAFLIEHDSERDVYQLSDPEIDIDEITSDNATVLIELELIDDIEIIPDPQGPIFFDGQRYKVDIAPINLAENVDVNVQSQQ